MSQGIAQNESIRIRGARVHNLKNIDIDIPRDQFVVITGPSGSGKSSLAFDTLFAEGQRQYIESLSVYARQFLHQMERPDVDLIEGLQPTICIDQRPGNTNPRSTLATVTEIYDYLRLLMARLGDPVCYQCGTPICQQTASQIQESLLQMAPDTKVMILAPMVRGRRGKHEDVMARIRKAGFVRVRVDGQIYDIDQVPELNPRKVHHVDAIVDRIIIRDGIESRVADSVRLAVRHGEGLMSICYLDTEQTDPQDPKGRWIDRLFSTLYACPNCDISFEELEPRTFSFNSPYGACPRCDGLGHLEQFDPNMVLPDLDLSLAEGAIEPWKGSRPAAVKKQEAELAGFMKSTKFAWDTPICQLSENVVKKLLYGDGKRFLGVLTILEKEYATTTKAARLEQLENFRASIACPQCDGSRLRPEANSVRVGGKTIHEICQLSIEQAAQFFGLLAFPEEKRPIADPLLSEIRRRLEFLSNVGVTYLTLSRAADTLSGGELQRVRLATSIGSGLIGVCYVLDEPSIGLHPRDNQRLIETLRDLQQQGNSVLVVEHDEAMMRIADHLIDVGPAAGHGGGEIVAQGSPATVIESGQSITSRYLRGENTVEIPAQRRRLTKSRSITLEGAAANNLKEIDTRFPLGALVCVTGVSGSGKSTLVNDTLARALSRKLGGVSKPAGTYRSLRGANQIDKIIRVDQSPIGRTPRSTPATYIGVFDEIRKLFAGMRQAKQRGFSANRFSFNVKGGRCEDCQGFGLQKIEMNFLPDLFVTCPQCQGRRFNRQTLEVQFRGMSIADVLQMAVEPAAEFFESFSSIHAALRTLCDVGLGYLSLGQPSTTLSGGEAQRIKLASELARTDTGKTLYLLDEPTTGLHFDDVRRLMTVLGRLVDRGNTVIVIEHNLDVIKCADWVIDLGPEGGQAGGEIVACGTPEEVAAIEQSYTGRFLRAALGANNSDS